MSKIYKGIDISLYQGRPDFAAIADAGIDFVMLKASQGRTAEYDAPFADPEFKHNVVSSARAFTGKSVYAGAYHYLCARNIAEAEAEADFFIALVMKYRYNLQLWAAVDVEDGTFLPQDKAQLTAIVARFCEKVKAAGLRPMVYANSCWLDSRFISPAGVPVWEANWGVSEMPSRSRMWQYTSCGSVAGIAGNVDMNLARDIIGDANGDGKVNVKDAIAIMRRAAGWKVGIDEGQADLDRDGYVTVKDAVRLIREIAEG